MDYKDFELKDFLENEYFVSWVIAPNNDTDHFWSKWLENHPDKQELVLQAKEVIASVRYKNQFALTQQEYSQLFEQVLQANEKKNNQRFNISPNMIYRVAAVLVLGLAVTLGVLHYTQTDQQQSVAQLATTAAHGQKKTVLLSDGTKVLLNSGSSLIYPEHFDQSKREVELNGEAFFEVERDTNRPFSIKSGNITTTVLGTSFDVRSYPSDEEIHVAVITGKVKVVAQKGDFVLLTPDEMVTYNKSVKTLEVQSFESQHYIGWTKGLLVFDNENLADIFRKIERWYGVEIKVAEGLEIQGKYSGSYKNQPLDLVMKGIAYTSHFSYEINNKTIMINEE